MALTVNEQFNVTDTMLISTRAAGIETQQGAQRALAGPLPALISVG
jgi:hypothetical protein